VDHIIPQRSPEPPEWRDQSEEDVEEMEREAGHRLGRAEIERRIQQQADDHYWLGRGKR